MVDKAEPTEAPAAEFVEDAASQAASTDNGDIKILLNHTVAQSVIQLFADEPSAAPSVGISGWRHCASACNSILSPCCRVKSINASSRRLARRKSKLAGE